MFEKSKVKLFGGGGTVDCKILHLKQYNWKGKPPRKRFEISYIDPLVGYKKIARYPLHRIIFNSFDRKLFQKEIANFYD